LIRRHLASKVWEDLQALRTDAAKFLPPLADLFASEKRDLSPDGPRRRGRVSLDSAKEGGADYRCANDGLLEMEKESRFKNLTPTRASPIVSECRTKGSLSQRVARMSEAFVRRRARSEARGGH